MSPLSSCDLPADLSEPLSAAWSCSWQGLPCAAGCHAAGGLLPHLFTLTLVRSAFPPLRIRRYVFCGTVCLRRRSSHHRSPGVTRCHALWSPDFPPLRVKVATAVRPVPTHTERNHSSSCSSISSSSSSASSISSSSSTSASSSSTSRSSTSSSSSLLNRSTSPSESTSA